MSLETGYGGSLVGMILKMSSLWGAGESSAFSLHDIILQNSGFPFMLPALERSGEREETTNMKEVTGTELLMSKNFKQIKRVGGGYVSEASSRQLS